MVACLLSPLEELLHTNTVHLLETSLQVSMAYQKANSVGDTFSCQRLFYHPTLIIMCRVVSADNRRCSNTPQKAASAPKNREWDYINLWSTFLCLALTLTSTAQDSLHRKRMFKKALWSRSLVWCSECLLKDSVFPFLHSLCRKSTDEDSLHKCPLSPLSPSFFCSSLRRTLECSAHTTSSLPGFDWQTFFDSGAWGTAFLTPAEWIMQKKSTHFTAGCWPKHQGLCYSVVVVVKIDQMKWGEQQERKQNSGQSRANCLHGFVSPSMSSTLPLGKFHGPWGVTVHGKNKTKKWCLWGCKRDLFLKNLNL